MRSCAFSDSGRLQDLGLEQFSVSKLFYSILTPGFFLLACILQLHYFHGPFMRLTDLEHIPPRQPPAVDSEVSLNYIQGSPPFYHAQEFLYVEPYSGEDKL